MRVFFVTICLSLFCSGISAHAEQITKLSAFDINAVEKQNFLDTESIGFEITANIDDPSTSATFTFTLKDPDNKICLEISPYAVYGVKNIIRACVEKIPVSKFFSRHGNYTLIANAVFSTGPSSSIQAIFSVSDTSPPTAPSNIQDEGATTNDPTKLICSWSAAFDPQSGIKEYLYCIGTSPGLDNIVSWCPCGLSTSVTHTGLSLTDGTTYYFTVKAVNGAGLPSSPASSNGITYSAISSSLGITASPSAFSFAYDEATKSTTLNLQVSGASGVTLNRLIKRFTYSDGTIEEFPAETIDYFRQWSTIYS